MERQRIYLNSFGSRVSGLDFVLFGAWKQEVQPLMPNGEVDVEIYVSPQSLKILAQQVNEGIRVYERLYGPIVLTPNEDELALLQKEFPGMSVSNGPRQEG